MADFDPEAEGAKAVQEFDPVAEGAQSVAEPEPDRPHIDWSAAATPSGMGPGIPPGTPLKDVARAAVLAGGTAAALVPGMPLAVGGALASGATALGNPGGEGWGKPEDVGSAALVGGVAAPVLGWAAGKVVSPIARIVGRFLSPEAGEAAGAAAGEAAAPAAGEVPTEAATQGPAEAKPGIVARAARASIEPSEQIPEAKWIDDQFAKNGMAERLTVGQNAPRSGVGQIEQASLSLPEEGAAIFAKREAARTGWQNLGLKQALPPGMEKVPEGSLPEKLDAIYQGFKPAYSAIRNETVPPVVEGTPLADALPELANDPGVLATDADRAAAAKWLDNQATLIKGDAETVPAENLIEMRSNIRDQMRKLPNGSPFKAVLDRAEDAITQSLDEGLSPEAAQALHQTDAKYRLYKVMEDAVARGGDRPGGFTSFQAEQALRHAMDRGEFARGGGGFLRQWIRSGRAVFETTSPPTGARAVTLADKLKEYLTGKLATGMNAAAPAPEPTAMPQAAGRAAAAVAPSAVEGMAQGGEVTGATINRTGLDEPRSQLYDYMARRQGTPTTMLKDQRDEVRRDVSRRRQANPAQDFILSQVNPEYRRKAGSYDPSRKTPSVP